MSNKYFEDERPDFEFEKNKTKMAQFKNSSFYLHWNKIVMGVNFKKIYQNLVISKSQTKVAVAKDIVWLQKWYSFVHSWQNNFELVSALQKTFF